MLAQGHVPAPVMVRQLYPRAQRFWARALTLLILLFATPAGSELVREVLHVATAAACCDEPCPDGDRECCPGGCAHCKCCAHPAAILVTTGPLPSAQPPTDPDFVWPVERGGAPGVRAPPFRPPAT